MIFARRARAVEPTIQKDWFSDLNQLAAKRTEPPRQKAKVGSTPDDKLLPLIEKYLPTRRTHNYHPYYWRHFRDIHLSVRRVVEIGVYAENSLRLWEDFFPNAEILGIDIDPRCASFAGGRRRVFIGDQQDPVFLQRFIAETGGDFDVVIDDGAHTESAIMTSLVHLLPACSPHGLYAIEDLNTLDSLTDYLARLAVDIGYYPPGLPGAEWPYLGELTGATWLQRNVTGIALYRFLCIIQRGFNPEDNPYLPQKR